MSVLDFCVPSTPYPRPYRATCTSRHCVQVCTSYIMYFAYFANIFTNVLEIRASARLPGSPAPSRQRRRARHTRARARAPRPSSYPWATGSARARRGRPGESGQHTSRDERPHYLIRRMTRATTIATPTNATMVPKWMQGSTIRRRCSTRMA